MTILSLLVHGHLVETRRADEGNEPVFAAIMTTTAVTSK